MKFQWIIVIGLGLLAGAVVAQDQAADSNTAEPIVADIELKTLVDKASYGIGLNIGRQFHLPGIEIKTELVARGLADAIAERTPLLSDEELKQSMLAFQQEIKVRQAEKNKKEGDAFLAANKTKDGVVTLPSGLQYTVLETGTGASPSKTDTVTTHYHGTLIDGTVFDSSVQRGQPSSFPVGRVIAGWTEALQLMKVGDKWRLFVPSELAYGANPRPGGPIGPDAVLVFEVELLSIGN